MAEVVGLAASILQIAGAGAKLSTTLYNFVGSAVRADQEITDIAGDVELTANALDSVGRVFQDEEAKTVVSKKAIQDANNLIKRCETVFNEIHGMTEKRRTVCKDGKKKLSALGKFSWPMKEQRVQLYRGRLESIKSSLMLLLHVLQLANGQAKSKLDQTALDKEREKIRELYLRDQESLKSLQALESKLIKVSLDDDEETLQGSNAPSRVPTIDSMASQAPMKHPDKVDKDSQSTVKMLAQETAATDDSDSSDSEGTVTDGEGEHLTVDELAKCAKHVQKLLKRISTLQQTIDISQGSSRHSKTRVHKLYHRFCRKFESDIFTQSSNDVLPSQPLPAFRSPSELQTILLSSSPSDVPEKQPMRTPILIRPGCGPTKTPLQTAFQKSPSAVPPILSSAMLPPARSPGMGNPVVPSLSALARDNYTTSTPGLHRHPHNLSPRSSALYSHLPDTPRSILPTAMSLPTSSGYVNAPFITRDKGVSIAQEPLNEAESHRSSEQVQPSYRGLFFEYVGDGEEDSLLPHKAGRPLTSHQHSYNPSQSFSESRTEGRMEMCSPPPLAQGPSTAELERIEQLRIAQEERQEDEIIIDMEENKNMTWEQMVDFFPGESSGTLWARYLRRRGERKDLDIEDLHAPRVEEAVSLAKSDSNVLNVDPTWRPEPAAGPVPFGMAGAYSLEPPFPSNFFRPLPPPPPPPPPPSQAFSYSSLPYPPPNSVHHQHALRASRSFWTSHKRPRMAESSPSPPAHGPPSVVGQEGMPPPASRPRGPMMKFTPEDDQLLIDLKVKKNLTWKQIADFFPGRTSGTLQVRYSKVRKRTMSSHAEGSDVSGRAQDSIVPSTEKTPQTIEGSESTIDLQSPTTLGHTVCSFTSKSKQLGPVEIDGPISAPAKPNMPESTNRASFHDSKPATIDPRHQKPETLSPSIGHGPRDLFGGIMAGNAAIGGSGLAPLPTHSSHILKVRHPMKCTGPINPPSTPPTNESHGGRLAFITVTKPSDFKEKSVMTKVRGQAMGSYLQKDRKSKPRSRYPPFHGNSQSFTPLVSPVVTPPESQFQISDFTTAPGAYFSPLTSPALIAQNHQQASSNDPVPTRRRRPPLTSEQKENALAHKCKVRCQPCRTWKVKCDGNTPCKNCIRSHTRGSPPSTGKCRGVSVSEFLKGSQGRPGSSTDMMIVSPPEPGKIEEITRTPTPSAPLSFSTSASLSQTENLDFDFDSFVSGFSAVEGTPRNGPLPQKQHLELPSRHNLEWDVIESGEESIQTNGASDPLSTAHPAREHVSVLTSLNSSKEERANMVSTFDAAAARLRGPSESHTSYASKPPHYLATADTKLDTGSHMGRRPSISPPQVESIIHMAASDEHTIQITSSRATNSVPASETSETEEVTHEEDADGADDVDDRDVEPMDIGHPGVPAAAKIRMPLLAVQEVFSSKRKRQEDQVPIPSPTRSTDNIEEYPSPKRQKHTDDLHPSHRHSRTLKCDFPACPSSALIFTRLRDLQLHQDRVHGTNFFQYPCPLPNCKRKIDTRLHLIDHLRTFHNLDVPDRKLDGRLGSPMELPDSTSAAAENEEQDGVKRTRGWEQKMAGDGAIEKNMRSENEVEGPPSDTSQTARPSREVVKPASNTSQTPRPEQFHLLPLSNGFRGDDHVSPTQVLDPEHTWLSKSRSRRSHIRVGKTSGEVPTAAIIPHSLNLSTALEHEMSIQAVEAKSRGVKRGREGDDNDEMWCPDTSENERMKESCEGEDESDEGDAYGREKQEKRDIVDILLEQWTVPVA